MRSSVLATLVVSSSLGCGTQWRFHDVSKEPAPRVELRAARTLRARAVCSVTFERAEEPSADAEDLGRALFLLRRSEKLAHLVEELALFECAETRERSRAEGSPRVHLRTEERVGERGESSWPHCMNGYATVMLGIGIPFIPLRIVQSHEYRALEPDLRTEYRLVVTSDSGTELARFETEALMHIEAQQLGGGTPDPLLRDPHRAVLDAGFERGARVLLAKLLADRMVRETLEREHGGR